MTANHPTLCLSRRKFPMKTFVLSFLLIGLVFASVVAGEDRPLPGGWRLQSLAEANLYRIGLDHEIRHSGKSAAFLESRTDWDKNHYDRLGSAPGIEQWIDATKYRGKRVRLSAFLRSQDVKERAFLAANVPNPWADMSDFATTKPFLEGTTDWKRYEIEFNVIHYAKQIEIAVELQGTGRVWVDELRLEVLGDTGEPTGAEVPKADPLLFDELANTDFEQTELEYQLGLLQGLWETHTPSDEAHRTTMLVEGKKQTYTIYDADGKMQWQVAFDFAVERSGRMSLMTRRYAAKLFDVAEQFRYAERWSGSFPFTVNRLQFVQILHTLDGSQGPPVLQEWKRVEK
jgi:hypothetical protein